MDGSIKYSDLVFAVLFLLGSFLLVYLILVLANIHGILKDARKTLKKNLKNIDDTLVKLPEISNNAAQITKVVKEEAETIQSVIDNVGKISDSAKETVDTIKNDMVLKVKGLLDVIDIIKQKFFSEKAEKTQKPTKKKKNKKEVVYSYKYGNDNKPEEVIVTKLDDESDDDTVTKKKMEKASESNQE